MKTRRFEVVERTEGRKVREKMKVSRYVWIAAIYIALNLWVPEQGQAKAWVNGHIVEIRPDGIVLRTRFHPHIAVHFSDQTVIRCKKHVLKTSDLEADDLVTVEGRDKHGVVEASKITIHRDWLKCREIKGAKPCHCKC